MTPSFIAAEKILEGPSNIHIIWRHFDIFIVNFRNNNKFQTLLLLLLILNIFCLYCSVKDIAYIFIIPAILNNFLITF